MAEDRQESTLDIERDCSWVRALDINGKSIRIAKADMVELIRENMPVATSEKNGLMSAERSRTHSTFNIPTIDSQAIAIAEFDHNASGFYDDSLIIHIDVFQVSLFGIFSLHKQSTITVIGTNKFIGHGRARALITQDGNNFSLYITGTYSSSYSYTRCEAFASSERIRLLNNRVSVPVTSIPAISSYDLVSI